MLVCVSFSIYLCFSLSLSLSLISFLPFTYLLTHSLTCFPSMLILLHSSAPYPAPHRDSSPYYDEWENDDDTGYVYVRLSEEEFFSIVEEVSTCVVYVVCALCGVFWCGVAWCMWCGSSKNKRKLSVAIVNIIMILCAAM